MKFLVALAVLFGLYLSFPHLQRLLLEGFVNQKVEQLKDDMMESLPLESPELPLELPKPLGVGSEVN